MRTANQTSTTPIVHPAGAAGGNSTGCPRVVHLLSQPSRVILMTRPRHVLGSTTIELALPSDQPFVESLQRKHVNSTGFVPTTAMADHLERQSYRLLLINGQPVGYSMHSGGIRKPHRLIQVAISTDAWRYGLGTLLIQLALKTARACPKPHMTVSIRDGLPMNDVVKTTGAFLTAYDDTPTARGKSLMHYAWRNPPAIECHEHDTKQPP